MNAAKKTATVALRNPTPDQLTDLNEWGLPVQTAGARYGTNVAYVICDPVTAREMRAHFGALALNDIGAAMADETVEREERNVGIMAHAGEGWDR